MRKRTMRVLLTALLVVLCAAISLGVYVWSIFQPAHVDVTCSGDNEAVRSSTRGEAGTLTGWN